MDFFKRLSDYDIFAYLPPGFLAIAAVDYLFGSGYVLDADWDVAKGFLIIVLAYVAGHLVAGPSAKIIERWLVRKVMKQPATHLLTAKPSPRLAKLIFADYYTPLAEPFRKEVLDKLGVEDSDQVSGENLFWKAYPLAKRDPDTKERMNSFLNLYGFCRNVCFVSGLASVAVLTKFGWNKWISNGVHDDEQLLIAITFMVIAFLMFQRYLKFHRLYCVEVFTALQNKTIKAGF